MTLVPFQAAHSAMDRLDGPIGNEITRIQSDFEQLVSEFTHNGAVDSHSVHMIRAGLDRLDKFGELCALRDGLAEKARAVGRLVDELGQNQDGGALARVQRHLDFQMAQVAELADQHTA